MKLHPMVRGYGYANCRLIRHSWEIVPSDWTPRYGVPFTLRCMRCGTERRMGINQNTGDIQQNTYKYPKGYSFARDEGGIELPKATDFRLAWLANEVNEMQKRRAERAARQKERIGR